MNSGLRWGFLGASRIGNALAGAMRSAGHTLHGVAARDSARAVAYAEKHGFACTYDTYEELLQDPQVDAVYNPLPNHLHFPWTARALQAGKHVLCEKPFMLNSGEVQQLMTLSRPAGLIIAEAFMHRHHPQYVDALAAIGEGALGELRTANASYRFTLSNPTDYRWHAAFGGGALYDVGCYCVSALRLLLGREPVRVSASQRLHGDIDATLTGWMDFNDGFTAHFDCSLEANPGQHLTLVGSTESLTFDVPFGPYRRTSTLQVGSRTLSYDAQDPYQFMVEHFAAAVTGQADLRWGLPDALRQAHVLDALFSSARLGQVIRVPQDKPHA
jgi:predicted dehydrogenase